MTHEEALLEAAQIVADSINSPIQVHETIAKALERLGNDTLERLRGLERDKERLEAEVNDLQMEIGGGDPEMEDARIRYVSVQVYRSVWLACREAYQKRRAAIDAASKGKQ